MFDDEIDISIFPVNSEKVRKGSMLFFLSCQYPNDAYYGNLFEKMVNEHGVSEVAKPLPNQEVETNQGDDLLIAEMRKKVLLDSNLTVVLLGRDTWRTYQTDWVLAASMSGEPQERSGVVGLILPTHPDFHKQTYNTALLPPRMADNVKNDYVILRKWSDQFETLQNYCADAANRRETARPENNRKLLKENLTGEFWN